MEPRTTLARIRVRLSPPSGMERRLMAGFGSTALVLMVAAFAFAELAQERAAQREVEHTIDVIGALQALRARLTEAESAQRGYILTSDPAYRDPYRDATAQVSPRLDRVRALTAGDPGQRARVDALEQAVAAALAALAETVRVHDAPDHAGALERVRSGGGLRAMESVDHILDEMSETAGALLRAQEAAHERSRVITAGAIGGGSLFAFALGLGVNYGIRRAVHERQRDLTLIEAQALRLEAQAQALQAANGQLDEHVNGLLAAKAEVERALAERSQAASALEKANQELDQFAYAASHDLKAPLRGIAHLSEWIEDDLGPALTDKSREHLRLLSGRVHRMEALIDGMLAYSRASRSKDTVESFSVAKILGGVVELLSPPAGVVTLEAPEAMPQLVAQRGPFQQVWKHLVGNALKHAAGPGATVRLAARDAGDVWEFSVSDNGPGIEPQYHERIFRMFHMLTARDKVEGTGVGLAIVKKIVEARGGRVWVESALGSGAIFRFTWRK